MILKDGKRIDGCSDTVPIGTLNPYIGTTAPFGYLICEGQLVSKTTYPELYAICGSTFGTETATEFYLPDLRGQTIAGYKSGDSTFGTLGGLIGEATHILTIDEMPSHNHTARTSGKYSKSATSGSTTNRVDASGTSSTATPYTTTINNTGGGQAHNNIQPTMVLNWIVKAIMLMPNQSVVANEKTTSDINTYSCNYINSLQEKAVSVVSFYRTSGWTTQSTTDVAIPNATATVTTNGGNVLVTVTTSLNVTGNMAFVALYVDDTLHSEILCLNATIGNQSLTASALVTNLSAGEHTFALKMHVQNTNNVATLMTYNMQQIVIREL